MSKKSKKLIKVAIVGPECTGKTSLAKSLSELYKTDYVPEFARIYADKKIVKNEDLTIDDVLPIANGQLDLGKKAESCALNNKKEVLFFDTTLINTCIYAKLIYGYKSKYLDNLCKLENFDIYLLIDYVDIKWIPDPGQRSDFDTRESQYDQIKNKLKDLGWPYYVISGSLSTRVDQVVKILQKVGVCLPLNLK